MGHYVNGFYVFSPVSADDRAGILYVATILSLIFSVLTLIVRYHIQRRTFGLDFWFIFAATVCYYVFMHKRDENVLIGIAVDCCIRSICSYIRRAGQLCFGQGCPSHVQE